MRWTGDEIRQRRKLKGFDTQQQLADAIEASRRAVASWELETSRPQGRFVDALDRVLGDEQPTGLLLKDADFEHTLAHLQRLHDRAAGA